MKPLTEAHTNLSPASYTKAKLGFLQPTMQRDWSTREFPDASGTKRGYPLSRETHSGRRPETRTPRIPSEVRNGCR